MMAGMLTQLPLPLLPAGAAEIAPGVGLGWLPAPGRRGDQALAAGGVAGLVPARRGPKGASKLTTQLVERIAGLDAAGATLRELAAASSRSVDVQRA